MDDSIPRISVWKDDMIKFYSNLDLKSPSVYGYRPLIEFERTCYYKVSCIHICIYISSFLLWRVGVYFV